jgi:hypothetical protein
LTYKKEYAGTDRWVGGSWEAPWKWVKFGFISRIVPPFFKYQSGVRGPAGGLRWLWVSACHGTNYHAASMLSGLRNLSKIDVFSGKF